MNNLRKYSWIVPFAIFLVHQFTQKVLNLEIPFADRYLDPFCLGALSLYGLQWERRWLFGVKELKMTDILLVTLYLIIISEILFPFFSADFIQDWYDALSITAGTGWFIITRQRTKDVTDRKS